MRANIFFGLGVAVVLGAGIWIGRSTSATAEPPAHALAPASTPRSAEMVAPAAPTQPPRAPALQRPPATPGLAADLADRDPKVRRAAIREAAGDRDLDPALLLAASRDRDLEVGVIAMDALGKRYAEGAIGVGDLGARATDRSLDDRVRVTALNALGIIASPEAGALLVELVTRGSALERGTAAILLAHQDPEVAIPALIMALGDAEENVRHNAAEALRTRSRGRDFGRDAAAWRAWWQSRPL